MLFTTEKSCGLRTLLNAVLTLMIVDQVRCQSFKEFYNRIYRVGGSQGSETSRAAPLRSLDPSSSSLSSSSLPRRGLSLTDQRPAGRATSRDFSGYLQQVWRDRARAPAGTPGSRLISSPGSSTSSSSSTLIPGFHVPGRPDITSSSTQEALRRRAGELPGPGLRRGLGTSASSDVIFSRSRVLASQLPPGFRVTVTSSEGDVTISAEALTAFMRPGTRLPVTPGGREVTISQEALAALLRPNVVLNPDGIPKSMLAVLTGDPDYTRFRQLFLRQMCQRILETPRSVHYQFCFSLLAL